MKHKWLAAVVLVAGGIGVAQAHTDLSLSVGLPVGPAYYGNEYAPPPPPPAPVYYQPAPVYPPAPVYYAAPEPVFVAPGYYAPGYYGPGRVWWGGGYYHGGGYRGYYRR